MRVRSIPLLSLALLSLALLFAGAPCAVHAQAVVQPLPGNTDADRLAQQVHRLAANPQDLDALVTAGDLSIKLDDPTAAAAFFTRADKIDPHSARVKAGEGALLVRNERPGEALRYFAQAESFGLSPDAFASDRGLAYDLIGEQARAQRDYRTALKAAPGDDEAIRRYALSLGISGKRQQALDTLAPLLTNTDRAAWRARAFVLAMNGDIPGAEHIATTMMPGGIAQGLQAFFERLPTLDAIDRAFAVHFGEVRSSPQRLADARLAPAMTPLPAEPVVAVAVVAAPEVRKGRKDRRQRPVAPAVTQSAPVQMAAVQPAPAPVSSARTAPVAAATRETVAQPVAAAASAPPKPTTLAAAAEPPAVLNVQPTPVVAASPPPVTMPTTIASTPPPAGPIFGPSVPVVQQVPVTKPAPVEAQPLPAPGFAAMASKAVDHPTTVHRTRGEDAVLDRIMAGLSIPAAELNVADPKATRHGGKETASATPDEPEQTPAEKKAAERKAAAAAKALAAKKAAAAEKLAADKEAAKEAAAAKKAARANPSRIWVQVAGGANEDDLPKAWAAVKKKAPDAFSGRSGYKTPLRATNRVLAGPFKSDSDARAFVNALKKDGVSGFAFTSEAGQKIEKLPAE